MSRLIDADALINELNNSHYPGAPYVDAGISIAIGKVCNAPTIEPEQRWIPCSERLPSPLEWDEKYLVSLAWGGIGVMEYKSTGFHNYGSFNPVPIETVTAWMPLPDPYRGIEETMNEDR